MKRHNAKAIAAAVAIAAAASAEGKKKTESKQNLSSSALYVDVVKNMSRPDSSPPTTPPQPKFTILREEFPALPGTNDDLRGGSAAVPDDWTAIISDDHDCDDDDEDEVDEALEPPTPDSKSEQAMSVLDLEPLLDLLEELLSSGSSSNDCQNNSFSSEHETLEKEVPAVALVAATTDYKHSSTESDVFHSNYFERPSSRIFDKQFLAAGVSQRAWKRQAARETVPDIGPPPGFEHIKFYGRLRTNRMGVPLGGVTFDVTPPQRKTPPFNRSSNHMEGAFGLAGLANNLEAAQRNPKLFAQIFGYEAASLNVDAHCEANKLHACFGGPLQGGRCAPHEVNYDVPLHYRRAGGQDLPQPKIDQMEVELLFLFFYTYPGDMMQMLAAAELAERGWRFHIYERLWIRRQADNPNYIIGGYQESGEYNYFNMVHWKILARHFDLLPEQLERTITKAELSQQYGYHPQMSFF